MRVEEKPQNRKGILLDVGCRDRKELNWIGIDSIGRDGIDIVHDLERFPYPIENDSCITIKAAQVASQISPRLFFPWMDELWRILKVGGQLVLSAPYAGSIGFWHDPHNVTHLTEVTFQFLDPDFPFYQQYRPKPWNIEHAAWKVNGNIEAILRKRPIDDPMVVLARESIMRGAMQKVSELAGFYELIKKKPPGVVVEIGTARGGVLYGLCKLAKKNATIVSIDLPGGAFGGGYSEQEAEVFRQYGQNGQTLHFMRMDSHLTSTKKMLYAKAESVDLLFIDGDHTYEGVKKDFNMYYPLVKKGGMIVFHDICHHPTVPACKVDQFWKEVRIGRKAKEIIDPVDRGWGGIGVIWK